ncbi:MAG TPA: hypothetical protein ENI23_08650 [bacterium]|nr:hypothetical protein [bacterium]
MAELPNTNVQEPEQTNLQKEQFDTGMSDEDLLAQIIEWEKESETFYEVLKRVWDINVRYYRGLQTDVDLIVGTGSKTVENRIWMATETMVPIATSRLPDIVVKSGDEDEQSQQDAMDLQDVLGFHMERVRIQEKAERFIRNMIVKRYGVFKVAWNKKIDDVGLEEIDPKRIRVPRFGKDVKSLAFIIQELELSYEQAKRFFGEGKAKVLLEMGFQEGVQDTFHGPSAEPNKVQPDSNKQRRKTFTVKEVWTNDFVAWKAGTEILKSQKNPFFNFTNKKKNYFDVPRKPFIIKSLFQVGESILGETDYVQQLISVQDNINIRKRQVEDIAGKVANPVLLIDSDVMSEEQAANITNEAGLIIFGKDAAKGDKFRFESPGNVPNYLFADLETSRTQFDNIWGIHSTTRGEREGKETLGGRQLLRAADLGRVDLVARQLERALDEIAEYWTQLIKMFYNEKKTFSILGEDGTRFIQNFSGAKIGENVKPMVTAGSTLPKDEVSIRQEAIQLWQLGAIGIRTLYKALKMPNISEAIDDFAKTQQGQAGASPEVGGGTPTLPPQV